MRTILTVLLCFGMLHSSTNAVDRTLLSALKKEMKRTMSGLSSSEKPPYFLGYAVAETKSVAITASFGAIKSVSSTENRVLDIDLRVGDHTVDNTHIMRGSRFEFGGRGRAVELPAGAGEDALRQIIWQATDQHYKKAVERYGKVLTNMAVKVKEEDSSADFSREKPELYQEESAQITIDVDTWKQRLERLSSLFASDSSIYVGDMYFQADIVTKYIVNSENAELAFSESNVRLFATASTKADDGMTLPLYRSYFAFAPEGLPDEQSIAADIRDVVTLLGKLRFAAVAETFSGPAILSGEASGVFFHEIFGHRVEGHRQKDPNSSQTFKSFLNKKILPDFIDVVFDPTLKRIGGKDAVGFFKYDDEGVKAQKVIAVENGIFRNFLMSRSPVENFPNSNGHGRRQAGFTPVSRQSNLMVAARNKVSFDSLKSALRTECKKQNKEYGLYFVEISGGFTFTGRTVPNAFNVQPLVVYKIFADDRPDELVRGVDLIGTPLATFNNITLSANDLGVFNGVCGAESGGVPVSASSPSLLVSTIEVQKKQKSQSKPPILPNPVGKKTQ